MFSEMEHVVSVQLSLLPGMAGWGGGEGGVWTSVVW